MPRGDDSISELIITSEAKVDRDAAQRNYSVLNGKGGENQSSLSSVKSYAHEGIVFAADGLRAAGGATHTDDGEGRASESDKYIHVAEDDAKMTEDLRNASRISLTRQCMSGGTDNV